MLPDGTGFNVATGSVGTVNGQTDGVLNSDGTTLDSVTLLPGDQGINYNFTVLVTG
jgi:hypothetical protein